MHEGNSLYNRFKQIIKEIKGYLFTAILLGGIILLFTSAVNGANDKANDSGAVTLERALKRAAVQCYAIEGFYPKDTNYLEDKYGVIIDNAKYVVNYQAFTPNNMPDIKVKLFGAD